MASEAEIKIGQVDDVQELHRAGLETVPDRYIRDGDDRPGGDNVCALAHIPVIDVGELTRDDELNKLRLACEEWGFFQVVNHGIEDELLDEMEKLAREFFMLPLEEKEKYPMAPGGIQGYGHAFVFSEDQKLDWCNMLALGVEPAFIRQPKLWPTTPAKFKETLEKYSVEIRGLCRRLLAHIAETLGLAPGTFGDLFGEAVQAVRMNFYPPCPRPELVLGLSAHSDGSAVTVLQQDMSCAGLQVIKDGAWVPVHPIPHALVINLGDSLEERGAPGGDEQRAGPAIGGDVLRAGLRRRAGPAAGVRHRRGAVPVPEVQPRRVQPPLCHQAARGQEDARVRQDQSDHYRCS
ncbi:hypothetical protein PAHAL_5G027600 [Panicum hallii]|uniref:Fe2OG dioxygenase domain-containing protein n=1 Tax=Panicum hallii TaxID=206008 RepID=A0A2S3HNB8_9POAL|nr:hypothetical protein PAHAL_5G027600 [Panicum hallii]